MIAYFGVDFSGAVDAGSKIWISRAVTAPKTITITDTLRAANLPQGGRERGSALTALRMYIVSQGQAIWGLDFPFSLTAELIGAHYLTWRDFVLNFGTDFPQEESLFEQGRALKSAGWRKTDLETKTPFPTHNLRLFRQTYFGIRDLLAPLVRDNAINVAPMLLTGTPRPLLLEICPASFLKANNLYLAYKGKGEAPRQARAEILDRLSKRTSYSLEVPQHLQTVMIEDSEGDALDSALAAFMTARSVSMGEVGVALETPNPAYLLEGQVFGAL